MTNQIETPEQLDEIAVVVAGMTKGPWEAGDPNEDGSTLTSTTAEFSDLLGVPCDRWGYHLGYGTVDSPADAVGISTLRNNADELLRLARLGLATESWGGGREVWRQRGSDNAAAEILCSCRVHAGERLRGPVASGWLIYTSGGRHDYRQVLLYALGRELVGGDRARSLLYC